MFSDSNDNSPARGWGKPVGEYRYDSAGIVVPYYFVKSSKSFSARWEGHVINAESAKEIEKKIAEAVGVSLHLDWFPVIEVQQLRASNKPKLGSFVGIEVTRYFLAKKGNGKYRRADWRTGEIPDRDQFDNVFTGDSDHYPLGPNNPYKHGMTYKIAFDQVYYLFDNDEELWERLLELNRRIGVIQEAVMSMLEAPEKLLPLLQSVTAPELPAPKDEVT